MNVTSIYAREEESSFQLFHVRGSTGLRVTRYTVFLPSLRLCNLLSYAREAVTYFVTVTFSERAFYARVEM
jgi:hypothetical protein